MRMQTTWGAKTIDRAVESPSTIRIGASDMEMDGFIDDTFSEVPPAVGRLHGRREGHSHSPSRIAGLDISGS